MDYTPVYWFGGLLIFGALVSALAAFWPRGWVRFAHLGLFKERPEPQNWYLVTTSLVGIVMLIVCTASAISVLRWPGEMTAKKQAEKARIQTISARCDALLPLFTDAVQRTTKDGVTNTKELEELASANKVRIKWSYFQGVRFGTVEDDSVKPSATLFDLTTHSDRVGECATIKVLLEQQ